MPAITTPRNSSRLTLQEAARRRSIGQSTLRRKIADGILPAERIGRRIYISPGDLDALAQPIVGRPTAERSIDAAVARVVAEAPRLTPAQLERLAVILGGAQ
ncbi:helix-turn-helix domain-containing protein [Microbacterium sp. nov. GSS16]|uniref:helix-turn-helix domain-containing protein n=1 Tax=Microbacterium sp. nov. GSS16 TaxID=3019890 RepID=UPI002305323E|nr:helix-turn-helix domain-containing protein [Microbacterium sp. nov. GSS16]WCD91453.1 helix-turn-helix domain-containing protein [Microbacterium sp. nov. GSS16]